MTDEIKFELTEPELEAEIYYLKQEEGGRYQYVKSGYHGQFYYNGRDWDAPQQFLDRETCNPGETVKVRLQTLSPDFHVGQFTVGQEFETREGAKTVGKGRITKILRPDFNFWDYNTFLDQLPENCKPYDRQNIGGFKVDFEYGLERIEQIKNLKFTQTLSDKEQMLRVECVVKDKKISTRPLIDEICKNWREEIAFKNSLYKTSLKDFGSHFEFALEFATWHTMYLTGKILLSTK